jgi:hypothetical protein
MDGGSDVGLAGSSLLEHAGHAISEPLTRFTNASADRAERGLIAERGCAAADRDSSPHLQWNSIADHLLPSWKRPSGWELWD